MKKLILTLVAATIAFTQTVSANTGIEKRLFSIEKSVNPENILLINTFVDQNCKFTQGSSGNIDFYWLMNRQTKKEVHSLIRSNVQERVKFMTQNPSKTSFQMRLNDLSEIKHDLESNNIEVIAEVVGGNCQVRSVLNLGPSAKYRKMNLEKTYCDVKTNLVGVPNGCNYLELQGRDADTNQLLKVRFKGN